MGNNELIAYKIVTEKQKKKRRTKKDTKIWYYTSYSYFVKYFKEKKQVTKEDVIMGIAMVYSWMPTIPETSEELMKKQGKNVVKLVNDLIEEKKFDEETIEKLKTYINNSLPGTSKLLHFIKPDMYPLWDSRICEILTNAKYAVSSTEKYLTYNKNCKSLKKDKKIMKEIEKKVEKHLRESEIRAAPL